MLFPQHMHQRRYPSMLNLTTEQQICPNEHQQKKSWRIDGDEEPVKRRTIIQHDSSTAYIHVEST